MAVKVIAFSQLDIYDNSLDVTVTVRVTVTVTVIAFSQLDIYDNRGRDRMETLTLTVDRSLFRFSWSTILIGFKQKGNRRL